MVEKVGEGQWVGVVEGCVDGDAQEGCKEDCKSEGEEG